MIVRGYGRVINILVRHQASSATPASRPTVPAAAASVSSPCLWPTTWGRHGVTVNALAPGWFQTEQNRAMYQDEGWVEYLVERIPLKRPAPAR